MSVEQARKQINEATGAERTRLKIQYFHLIYGQRHGMGSKGFAFASQLAAGVEAMRVQEAMSRERLRAPPLIFYDEAQRLSGADFERIEHALMLGNGWAINHDPRAVAAHHQNQPKYHLDFEHFDYRRIEQRTAALMMLYPPSKPVGWHPRVLLKDLRDMISWTSADLIARTDKSRMWRTPEWIQRLAEYRRYMYEGGYL
jgi:hypothetical protein